VVRPNIDYDKTARALIEHARNLMEAGGEEKLASRLEIEHASRSIENVVKRED
jgi:hypothetical protein